MTKFINVEKYPWYAFSIGMYFFGDETYLRIDFFKYEVNIGRLN